MRFLGIGDSCDLGALYLRLRADGHEVKVFVANELAHGTLRGMVERTADWRSELDWVKEASDLGIVLFENIERHSGAEQDALRRDGINIIGGSAFGDRLETDRAFGQRVLESLGLPICQVTEFNAAKDAIEFIRANPARYVMKFNESTGLDNFVGRLNDGRDVAAYLAHVQTLEDVPSFILMEHVEGVEMGVGAYFNGERFLRPACLDWEHKRFFPGNLGELTGEMGTIVTYERTEYFFERTLAKIEPMLREHRHVGYVNLNTIVNERGIWPLEFTCRFGYPGFAILDPLQQTPWAELFASMIRRDRPRFDTAPGFCAGIVMTTPPFPYARPFVKEPVGLPVLFDGTLTDEDKRHLLYGEVGLDDADQLVTSGVYGWSMVVTGQGPTVAAAQAKANALAEKVVIPNVRYRRDIGAKLIAGDLDQVERLGLMPDNSTAAGL